VLHASEASPESKKLFETRIEYSLEFRWCRWLRKMLAAIGVNLYGCKLHYIKRHFIYFMFQLMLS
jgi:hypothetical protein